MSGRRRGRNAGGMVGRQSSLKIGKLASGRTAIIRSEEGGSKKKRTQKSIGRKHWRIRRETGNFIAGIQLNIILLCKAQS